MIKRIVGKPKINESNNSLSTAAKAGLTANITLTRGKQLVEEDPFTLIPDPFNPRPGEVIDDKWLIHNLHLRQDNSLCYLDANKEYIIPTFKELNILGNSALEESYNFLRELAFSLRREGIIEPIEVFLADRENNPLYFDNLDVEYGYCILEGHQRRLAAMISGLPKITCIEIKDETLLAKLQVRHRKLRRQLAENNLRKELTVSQNFQILNTLLKESEGDEKIQRKELSEIMGLSENIVSAMKKLCLYPNDYPEKFIELINNNMVSFRWIRDWIGKSYEEQSIEVNRLLNGTSKPISKITPIKVRGKSGGRTKKTVNFVIKNEEDCQLIKDCLLKAFPSLECEESEGNIFQHVETIFEKLLDIAKVTRG